MRSLIGRIASLLALLSLFVSSAARAEIPHNTLTDAEQRSGWKLLFDGKSAERWRNYRKGTLGDGWAVQDGTLARVKGGAGDIVTLSQYEHFELQLDYRISKGGNSGLMFHVTEVEDAPWMTGPEVQIQDNVDGHDPQKSGWLYQLYQPKKPDWAIKFENQVGFKGIDVDDATRPAGEWNQIYLRVAPQQSEVCVNGVSYYYFVKGSDDWNARVAKSKFAKMPRFGKPTIGHVCLQDHGNEIAFRNIKIRELSADGKAKEPIDGTLDVKTVLAFPAIEWQGWEPANEKGQLNPPLRPIHVTHAGDGSHRLFIVDQSGMIHFTRNVKSPTKAELFMDLRKRVHQFKVDDEEGVLGFAFHPKFRENGQFFIYYNTESKPRTIHLSRFTLEDENSNSGREDSEEILLTITQPFSNHNGGPMAFGPDGCLYIGMGDGGGRNDPMRLGQARNSFMGCVLRIDVDHKDEGKNYAVPKDNPFIGEESIPPEVWAYGIRNPWRVSFDKETGNLWLADVGQDLWEEIDIIRKGGNYGWSAWEGTHPFGNAPGSEKVKNVDPIWEYDHRIGKSITGGHVYRGEKIPELAGHYLYGDYVSGKVWALQYDDKAGKVVRNMAIPWNGQPVLAFGEDESGESFITTPSQGGRSLYRIVKGE